MRHLNIHEYLDLVESFKTPLNKFGHNFKRSDVVYIYGKIISLHKYVFLKQKIFKRFVNRYMR